jgi:hypothetical protein
LFFPQRDWITHRCNTAVHIRLCNNKQCNPPLINIYQKYRSINRIKTLLKYRHRIIVFDATFNNISDISTRSVLLVEETRVTGENHLPAASHWQTFTFTSLPVGIQVWFDGIWFCVLISENDYNKTDHHDITKILLKVVLNTITLTFKATYKYFCIYITVFVLTSICCWFKGSLSTNLLTLCSGRDLTISSDLRKNTAFGLLHLKNKTQHKK